MLRLAPSRSRPLRRGRLFSLPRAILHLSRANCSDGRPSLRLSAGGESNPKVFARGVRLLHKHTHTTAYRKFGCAGNCRNLRYFSSESDRPKKKKERELEERHQESGAAAAAQEASGPVPAFPVRVGLVGAAAGLGTPIFAVFGIAAAWYKYHPTTIQGKLLKYSALIAFGGSGYTLICRNLIPFLSHHGELILPFALSNCLAASICYAGLEKAWGLKAISGSLNSNDYPLLSRFFNRFGITHIPIAGPLVGAMSACINFVFWAPMIKLCWPPELQTAVIGADNQLSWLGDVYCALLLPVGLPIGICAGIGLHYLLVSTITGTSSSGGLNASFILAGIALAAFLYFYVCSTSVTDLYWELRTDIKTGNLYSYNVKTGGKRDGSQQADESALYRAAIAFLSVIDMGGVYTYIFRGTNAFVPQLSESDVPKSWADLDNSQLDAKFVDSHMHFVLLLDRLLRLKYFQIKDRQEYNSYLNSVNSYYEFDAQALLEGAEAGIIVQRKKEEDARAQMHRIRNRIERSFKNKKVSQTDESTPGSLKSSVSEMLPIQITGNEAAAMVMDNLSILEERMKLELNYAVEDEVLEIHREVLKMEDRTDLIVRVIDYTSYASVAGISLYLLALYISRMGR